MYCRRTRKKLTEPSRRLMKRIDVLPDDVLLEIFGFYMITKPPLGKSIKKQTEEWQSLIHVCRQWRNLVFLSPRRLNLQLYCTPETPARCTLDVWPALPLLVGGDMALSSGTDNIIAALGQSNRVYQVSVYNLAGWQLEKVLAPMQVPFPELTSMFLLSPDETPLAPLVIPDSFLDGSAPRLQRFSLSGISFLGLPKLLLSATHLVYLHLYRIPHSGYISPEVMVALLSMSTSLEQLSLEFQSPQSRPGWENRSLPPPKRFILPALHVLSFTGVTDYLEELVTYINTPQLKTLIVSFFNQIDFDIPRLAQFINDTPTLRARDEAHVRFHDTIASVTVTLEYQVSDPRLSDDFLHINTSCREPDWQLSFIEQVCNSALRPLSTVQDLFIEHEYGRLVWKNDAIESTLWLQLLLPFTAVKNLYLAEEFAPGIAAALREFVGLPSLQNVFVEALEPSGSLQENIGQFVATRQPSDHPIAISVWHNQNMKRRKM